MANFDLNAAAVSRASGDDAGTVLGALLETPGIGLVHEYTMAQSPAPAAPSAPAAPGMGGGSGKAARAKSNTAESAEKSSEKSGVNPVVPEYEVFRNDNNAVAFFLNRQASADLADDGGPFWFMIHDENNIVAGNDSGQAFFADVAPDVIDTAKTRGIILLVEFEDQQPVRCTPCYFMQGA